MLYHGSYCDDDRNERKGMGEKKPKQKEGKNVKKNEREKERTN